MSAVKPTVVRDETAAKIRKVLFARIGWMVQYAGPQPGDERPTGGGGYNKKKVGHELFNFYDFGGRLYGFVRAKNDAIKLKRIDPAASEAGKLEDVLVIFVAKQRIVGWYRSAVVHTTTTSFPVAVKEAIGKRLSQARTKNFKLGGYRFEAPLAGATLLPTYRRTHEIPGHVKGGFGQSNVCYLYSNDGRKKSGSWMEKAIDYVLGYSRENLLSNPEAEAGSEEAAVIAQEQRAGFQSNPEIRRAVEKYAMQEAKNTLKKRGYRGFFDTSSSCPYDYTCSKYGTTFYVEVKGTQAAVKNIILTKNEVEHVKAHPDNCILVIVADVKVSLRSPVIACGGTPEVRERWQLHPDDLRAIQFVWTAK